MKARLIARSLIEIDDRSFTQTVIWEVPHSLRGSVHRYKYRLAYVVDGVCAIRYDNETGKGDDVHHGDREVPYTFTSIEALLETFIRDVERWRR